MYTYKRWLAFDVKDYLSCYRGGWVNLFYSGDMGQKLISQLPKMIDTSSKTDMYVIIPIIIEETINEILTNAIRT